MLGENPMRIKVAMACKPRSPRNRRQTSTRISTTPRTCFSLKATTCWRLPRRKAVRQNRLFLKRLARAKHKRTAGDAHQLATRQTTTSEPGIKRALSSKRARAPPPTAPWSITRNRSNSARIDDRIRVHEKQTLAARRSCARIARRCNLPVIYIHNSGIVSRATSAVASVEASFRQRFVCCPTVRRIHESPAMFGQDRLLVMCWDNK